MSMLSPSDVQSVLDNDLLDASGAKVGSIADVYLDRDTQEPEWALVNTGMFGGKQSFVPITDATREGNGLKVRFTKDQIKDAPRMDADGELSQDDEAQLSSHYGLTYSEGQSDTGLPGGGGTQTATTEVDRGTGGAQDTSGPNTDSAMTVSEERLRVDKVQRPSQLVRLRKEIVTEDVNMTVPVQKEVLRVEREPITDANRGDALDGPDLSTEETEITLTEEQVSVEKDVVPVERVRLDKDVVTEERTVSDTVRKERVEVEGGEEVLGTTGTTTTDREDRS